MVTIIEIASVFSATCAGAGFVMTSLSFREARRSNDLQAILKVLAELRDAEKNLLKASGEGAVESEIVNLLNLYEVLSAAVNYRLIRGATLRIVTDNLINGIILIQGSEVSVDIIEEAFSSDETYRETLKFMQFHRKVIENRGYRATT